MQTTNWQSELKGALRSTKEIISFFGLSELSPSNYNCLIPISFANKIKKLGKDSALWKQFIPKDDEILNTSGLIDPIGDKKKSQGSGIIQRYKSRILFTPTSFCPVICRYCFRKNELSSNDEIFKHNTNELVNYLKENPSINEVILTGGDPLMLGNKNLKDLFTKLRDTQIKFIRIHTRTPIILPSRIDDEFIELLNEYSRDFQKIIFILHTNHQQEIDNEVKTALLKLKSAPVIKFTQSVLLKGVNDSKDSLEALFYKVLECDFTPYYLHHPDKVKGAMHFYVSLEQGREIYLKLRDNLPGWAIPHYIIDHPSGSGKQLAFNPESIEFSGKFLNKEGSLLTY